MHTLVSFFALAAVVELDVNNWDDRVVTSGKSIFVKFYAPWCGHCKAMAPDWAKLGDQFGEDAATVIGKVDCTSEGGKPLCERYEIKGFPTMKHVYGDMKEDYNSGRDLESLLKFAGTLKPLCSLHKTDACTDSQLKLIEAVKAMDGATLAARQNEIAETIKESETSTEKKIEVIKAQYEKLVETATELKNSLGFETAVLKQATAAAADAKKDEL